jgi:hypothetical protein
VHTVVLLVLLDAQREVGKLEILLLDPVDHVQTALVPDRRLVLLQLLLLVLQTLQVLLQQLDTFG